MKFLYYSFTIFVLHIIPLWLYTYWAGFSLTILGLTGLLIVQAISLFLSMTTVDLFLALFFPPSELPSQGTLSIFPRIAILYVTCDDAIQKSVMSLLKQNYPNFDVFMLDDSCTLAGKQKVNTISTEIGVRVFRRENKVGYKAGNLNNWLKNFGKQYKYIILADCDSILPADFATNMVKYAEHIKNSKIAVFQSKTQYWNNEHLSARVMESSKIISDYLMQTLGYMDLSCSFFGHNCLIRTNPLINAGGFPEEYVAEDFALQLRFDSIGYKCRMVNIISYEAYPCNYKQLRHRARRWAAQTLELLKYPTKGLSPNIIIALLKSCFSYSIWLFYLIGISLILGSLSFCGVSSEHSNVFVFRDLLINTIQNGVILIPILFFSQIILRCYLAIRLGVGVRSFIKQWLWGGAEAFFLMVPISFRVVSFVIYPKAKFTNTYSSNRKNSFFGFLYDSLWLLFWILSIIAIFRHPLFLTVNWYWLAPVIFSPAILFSWRSQWI